jgi:cytochrome oxidase Cu insertion factor (SCO1/SenC/PrrC family)
MRNKLTGILAVLALVVVALLAGRHYLGMFSEDGSSTVEIGGPFTLTDAQGNTVRDEDFRGKFMLVYFGYTYCPDVCPTSLTAMAESLDALGDKAANITPIFITVDPERDDMEGIGEYAAAFHPSLIGLTGSLEQVKAAAHAYRVFYAKVQEDPDDPEDYLVDHSAYTYLMDPTGKYLEHFPHGADPVEMTRRIKEHL